MFSGAIKMTNEHKVSNLSFAVSTGMLEFGPIGNSNGIIKNEI